MEEDKMNKAPTSEEELVEGLGCDARISRVGSVLLWREKCEMCGETFTQHKGKGSLRKRVWAKNKACAGLYPV